jgi:archaellum component FlaC
MLSIPDELKELYKQENVFKYLTLYFPELDLTITNEKIVDKSFTLTESLCSETDLTFGACEAAMIEITVADIIQELSGKVMVITQTVEEYEMPLGTYIVDTAEKQSDKRYKQLTAYDYMLKTDIDVSAWYNGLTWPQTVKSMRESLLTYLGLAYESQTLTNDTVSLSKTINPASLIGRDILRLLCSINAGFGHFTRYNTFKVIQLSGLGLYPSETLYPSENLFPSESGEIITPGSYRTINYSEYIVEPITMVKIQSDDEDTGVTAGTGDNPYIMAGNYLLFGKTGTELQDIADEIFLQVKSKYYRQHTTVMNGLPYMEVGDSVLTITTNDAIESFIFKRVMTGVHTLVDTISATGNQYRSQTVSPNTEIQQLKNKTLRIQKSVDGVSIDLSNLETETHARFELQDDEIALKVSKGTISSEISVEPDVITLNSNRLIVNSTKFQLDEYGNATFSGDVISANMTGGTINGSEFVQSNGIFGRTEIKDGMVTALQMMLRPVAAGGASFAGNSSGYLLLSSANLNYYNGSTITFSVTQGGSISCTSLDINGIAPSMPGHIHSSLYNGSNQVFLGSGGGFASTNGGDLGSPTFRWGTVYAQTGTINTSDKTLKNSIEDLPEIYEQLILRCRPVRFKYNDGTSDRYHTGFISQEVEELMNELGIDSKDFGGFVKAPVYEVMNEDGEFDTSSPITGYIYMLRYEEFISPAFQVIKKQQDQLKSQEERMKTIEERLKALEEGVKNG